MASAHIQIGQDEGWTYYEVVAVGTKGKVDIYSTQCMDDAESALELIDLWTPEEVTERDDFRDALKAYQKDGTRTPFEDEEEWSPRAEIDCQRCGDEFSASCQRAKGSDICLECAVELDPPSVPDFVAYDINESPSYRDAMIDAGRSNLLR